MRLKQSKEVTDRVLDEIMSGRSLNSICSMDRDKEKFPCRASFKNWLAKDEQLAEDYGAAMSLRAEIYFDQIIEIADSGNGVCESTETIQRDKLRIDARKWVVSRMVPKKYGEQTQRTTDEGESQTVFHKTTEYADGD